MCLILYASNSYVPNSYVPNSYVPNSYVPNSLCAKQMFNLVNEFLILFVFNINFKLIR